MTNDWRPFPPIPEYEVSEDGRVRSWKPERNNAPAPLEPRELKSSVDRYGYIKYGLYWGTPPYNTRGDFTAHRMVCWAFHGPPPSEDSVVRHLDGSRTNNHYTNLSWGSPKDNSEDAKIHGTWVHGTRVNTNKLTESCVKLIRKSKLKANELAEKFGVTPGTIYHIKRGHTWKHL